MLVLLAVFLAWYLTGNFIVNGHIQKDLWQNQEQLLDLFEQHGETRLQHHLQQLIKDQQQSESEPAFYYLLSNPEGQILTGNLKAWPQQAELVSGIQTIWISTTLLQQNVIEDQELDEVFWPVLTTTLANGNRLLLAHSVTQMQELHELAEFLLEAVGIAMLISLLMAWSISRTILQRIDQISETASEIMAGDMTTRIATSPRHDEFDQLAGHLNCMLDRIQQLINGMRATTDNVAHDLRHPLTRLRNRLEVTLLEARDEAEYRKVIQQAVKDTESLIETFNAILQITRLESGNQREPWHYFNLNQLVSDIGEMYQALAEQKQQILKLEMEGRFELYADRNLIAQALSNLLENALRYCPNQGRIKLSLLAQQAAVQLIVEDNGPGIPEHEFEHVQERFVRLESSRHSAGNGLGLSLVKAVCENHKARFELQNAEPGLRVVIEFDPATIALKTHRQKS